jgi:hypothetical protein
VFRLSVGRCLPGARGSRRIIAGASLLAAVCLALLQAPPAGASSGVSGQRPAAGGSAVAGSRGVFAPAEQPSSVPPAPAVVAAGDEIVTGTGDAAGWHLYAASSGGGWRWHALVTLQPGGFDGQPWIGEQCLTGDGRWIVAVVAPWQANNSAAGTAQGGVAYAVDAHTGAVRPLAAGVALTYFNPGCGAGHLAALTRYTDAGHDHTEVLVADAAAGSVHSTGIVRGQITSAVPAGGAVYAARGNEVVRLAQSRAELQFTVPGPAFRLTPDDRGGLDLLTSSAGGTVSVWRWAGRTGRAPVVAARGSLSGLRLFPGRAGRNRVVNATPASQNTGLQIDRSATKIPDGASLDGSAEVVTAGSRVTSARLMSTRDGAVLSAAPPPAAHVRVFRGLPRAAPAAASAGPAPAATAVAGRVRRPGAAGARALAVTAANTTTPTCAVPRNDPFIQVPQPNAAQIEWASNLAGRGTLTGPGGGPLRPGGALNLQLPPYSPSSDLPLPAPFGPGGQHIPREVLDGVFAQESNWSQATWHALPGIAGNPLIADYYGWVKDRADRL